MLREMRGRHGGPHVGTRALAVMLVLLLATPVTVLVVDVASYLLHHVV